MIDLYFLTLKLCYIINRIGLFDMKLVIRSILILSLSFLCITKAYAGEGVSSSKY